MPVTMNYKHHLQFSLIQYIQHYAEIHIIQT